METQHPRSASRERSARASTAATFGLAGITLCFAVFSIFAAYTARVQVDRAERVEAIQQAYVRATAAMQAAETAELEYHLDPTATRLVALDVGHQAIGVAVKEAAALGAESDAQVATDVLALQTRHATTTKQFAAAIAAGDTVEARRIDVEQSVPILQKMHEILMAAAADAQVANVAGFRALRTTAELTLVLAPTIFVIGFLCLIFLRRIIQGSHAAARRTYREIEQLSKLRSEFVSIVSHEFRTPLTGIQGFSEMMRDENMTLPEMREYPAISTKMRVAWPGSSPTCSTSTEWSQAA